jgi:VanZ family protein
MYLVEKLITKLEEFLPCDKAKHFTYGYFIYTVVLLFTLPLIGSIYAAFTGLAVTAIVAALKEVYDKKQPNHTYDVKDAVYTTLPGLLTTIIIVFVVGLDIKLSM